MILYDTIVRMLQEQQKTLEEIKAEFNEAFHPEENILRAIAEIREGQEAKKKPASPQPSSPKEQK